MSMDRVLGGILVADFTAVMAPSTALVNAERVAKVTHPRL